MHAGRLAGHIPPPLPFPIFTHLRCPGGPLTPEAWSTNVKEKCTMR
jgi:hypothetical protein